MNNFFLYGVPVAPMLNTGYSGYQNLRKCRRHHSGDVCTTGETIETSFSYMCQNVNTIYNFGYLGGLWAFNDQSGPIFSYSLTNIDVHVIGVTMTKP